MWIVSPFTLSADCSSSPIHINQHIQVGNERIRGISGGERRRLTLGEMLMTWSSIACWDEISTGLDAAATHDIALMTRAVVKAFKTTCIVSLLQVGANGRSGTSPRTP